MACLDSKGVDGYHVVDDFDDRRARVPLEIFLCLIMHRPRSSALGSTALNFIGYRRLEYHEGEVSCV